MITALPEGITPGIITRLSDVVSSNLGLHYPPDRWPDLLRGVQAMLTDAGIKPGAETEDSIRRLASGAWRPEDSDNLAHHLTVGETYFWREHQALEALQDKVLPPLLAQRRHQGQLQLRVWSAGCCTGEEPYSLAILLHRLLPDIENWDVRVLATDLNPTFLHKARLGRYRKWSFRGTPAWIKDRYFTTSQDESWEIRPEVKRLVDFATLNLASDSYPSLANHTQDQDIIFCRNVLIYMEPAQAQSILSKFQDSLLVGGWLVLSATEIWLMQSQGLISVTSEGAILFNKVQQPAGPSQAAGPPSKRSTRPASLYSEKRPAAGPQGQFARRRYPSPSPSTLKEANSLPGRKKAEGKPAPVKDAALALQEKIASAFEVASGLFENGQYSRVIENLTQLGASLPKNPLPDLEPHSLLLLAKAYANSGQAALALEACDRAISLDRLATAGYYLRAILLQEQNHAEEAMQALTRALFLDPGFIMAHFLLGNLAFHLGRTQEACRHWKNALQQLAKCAPEAPLPESESMTAQHLTDMITALSRSCE